MQDPLQLLVDDVKRRQLDAVRVELPGMFDARPARVSAATAKALSILNRLANQHSATNAFVTQLVGLAENDARFAFLRAIPDAPVLSMMRALALEQAAFGERTDAVAELALLMGLFTVLLDGLLDEAPEEFAPIAPWLDDVMIEQGWATGNRQPHALAADGGLHPIADLTVWLAAEAIRQIVASQGWTDPTVRAEFRRASHAAFTAEIRSAEVRISAGATPEARRHIVEKSTTCIWAGALLPFCVHGWPPGMAPRQFERFTCAVGTYGGWIDDIVDILVDARADRWSSVLLELDDGARSLGIRGAADARLARALCTPFLTARLPAAGRERLRSVRAELQLLPLPEDALLSALADMTYSCLSDDLAAAS